FCKPGPRLTPRRRQRYLGMDASACRCALTDRARGPFLSDENLVEIRELTRVYGNGAIAVRAVNGINLDVRRGEFLALCGVSGSGKSTLLQLIGALDTPTSGSIRVAGRELARLSSYERAVYRRATVGFVFQSFHLVPSMSAEANVALALTFQ